MDHKEGENPENTHNSGLSSEGSWTPKGSGPPKIVRLGGVQDPESLTAPRVEIEEVNEGVVLPPNERMNQPKKRNKGGRGSSIINKSPHREEYRTLMQAGWTSFALERYAAYRYGETISASTFRTYKQRVVAQIPGWVTPAVLTGKNKAPLMKAGEEARIDIMDIRQQLILLQLQRVSVDVNTELNLGKLFNTTGREIEMLSKLLNEAKQDQIDFGILPKVADEQVVTVNDVPAMVAPRHQTLGEALQLGDISAEDLAAVARSVGKVVPIRSKSIEAG